MIAVKAEISKVIETARQGKVIGHSLDVAVDLSVSPQLLAELQGHEEDMRSLLIVSQFQFVDKEQLINPSESDAILGLLISVSKAKGQKCNRCWIYSPTVGENTEHPTICGRCAETVQTT
jgi:isoleucyl-tRNA synthetase